jgi:16S rRNA (cytosine967-C5)-methyltransferase
MTKNPQSGEGAATRAAAARAVDCVLRQGMTLDRAFELVLSYARTERDASQLKAFAFGALRWHVVHQLIIGELLDRPLRPRDSILEALLSVALYQLLRSRQPAYAVVSSTVAAARELQRPGAAGMINATLRRFLRERDEILDRVKVSDEGRHGHPAWLIDRVRADWPDEYGAILQSALVEPPLWIRVNRNCVSRDDYQKTLTEKEIYATFVAGFPDGLYLQKPLNVVDLPGFSRGLVSIQDAASQLAAPILDPAPGMRVLDACAAPGGKATHLLEICHGKIDLVAVDESAHRIVRLEENLQRLNFTADVRIGDALNPQPWWDGRPFDRILIDAPCSATGVMRRHPDIKFLRRPGDIIPMANRQAAMLKAIWPLLKSGGRLLYATCSVLREENEAVIRGFLSGRTDARLVELPERDIPDPIRACGYAGYQCLPGAGDTDGLYYALIERLS